MYKRFFLLLTLTISFSFSMDNNSSCGRKVYDTLICQENKSKRTRVSEDVLTKEYRQKTGCIGTLLTFFKQKSHRITLVH